MEKNLNNQEAQKKLKKLAEEISICMFITAPDDDQSSRPMATIKADDDGTLWFYTHRSSGKTFQIENDQDVHLVYSHPGKESYMDVWGKSNVIEDRDKIRELWNPIVKAWFPQGVEDPDLCLLQVKPYTAHYWDSEQGKMIAFIKILTSAVTGKKLAEGVEGSLDIQ